MDVTSLPRLGIGISAEFDSARRGIDALALRAGEPDLVDFLEYGCDLARGLDDHARRWAAAGLPATYHFLDLNLTERDDADDGWLDDHRRARRASSAPPGCAATAGCGTSARATAATRPCCRRS